MKTCKLITTKPHKYGTRHLTAGDEYEVPMRHAFALVAGKKARFADKPVRAVAKPAQPTVVEPQPEPEPEPPQFVGAMTSDAAIDRLREEADQIGLVVDRRWGIARLQHEISQAKR